MKKFYIFLSALFLISSVEAQWVWKNPSTTHNLLRSSYFPVTNIGYVVGENGTILKTINGGEDWEIQASGTFELLTSVFFLDENTGWAGGGGTFLKTSNGGEEWIDLSFGNSGHIFFINADTGYIGSGSGILKTTNGGLTWNYINTDFNCKKIYFPSVDTGYAVGFGQINVAPKVLKTIDGGLHWTVCLSGGKWEYYYSVCFTDANTGYIIGDFMEEGVKSIYKTINGGTDWKCQYTTSVLGLLSVYFPVPDTGYVIVHDSAVILKTTNGGSNWICLPTGGPESFKSVFFTDSKVGYLTGENGKVLKTTDGCVSWKDKTSSVTENTLYSVKFTSVDTGYTVGENGTILKTIDGGEEWVNQTSGTTETLFCVCFIDANKGLAAGGNGTILRTENGGADWSSVTSGLFNRLSQVFFVDESIGYGVGYKTVIKSYNGGKDWINLNFGYDVDLLSVYFIDAYTGYVGGFSNSRSSEYARIYKTTDGGLTWNINFNIGSGRSAVRSLFFPNQDTGYAITNTTFLRNYGEGWYYDWGGGTSMCFPNDSIGYIVDSEWPIGGEVWRISNGGKTWTSQDPGVEVMLYSVDFPNQDVGYIVGWGGTILKTNTGSPPQMLLKVEPGERNVSQIPGSTYFIVSSNTDWAVYVDSAWCTVTSYGSMNDTIFVAYSENTSSSPRLAKITVSATGVDSVEVIVSQSKSGTGLENNIEHDFRIYPNPAYNNFTLETPAISKNSYLSIINLSGQELMRRRISESKTIVDITNLNSGIYIVKVISDRTVQVGKVVKE
jgi:photosystem II stability/assembly factor-like uncharacterized protein